MLMMIKEESFLENKRVDDDGEGCGEKKEKREDLVLTSMGFDY